MKAYGKGAATVKKRLEEWIFAICSKIPKDQNVPIILVGTHLDEISQGLIFC